ncbi:hypothetical protein [Ferruginibacter profundus]
MKVLVTITFLILTLRASGQSLQKIKQLLANKDFIAFKTYIDAASKKYTRVDPNSKTRAIWELKRDLTTTFQECIIDADESFASETEPNISTVQRYRINVLATSKKIIYYDFAEKESNGPSWDDFTLNITESFCNDILFADLKRDFFNTYSDSINQKELFNNSNVYGSACSIAGQKPEMREENDVIVENKNVQLLTKWLKSTNTERQVYGIDGLYQLKKKGYQLTAEQARLITIIKNKKGNLNICRGCIYSSDKISSIVKFILAGHTI